MTLGLSSGPHTLGWLNQKCVIPAGNESYKAYYFNNDMAVGPIGDQFTAELTDFVLTMFRGRGVKDRILNPNNSSHRIDITITSEGIRLFWPLTQTKGLKQWSLGGDEEKISDIQAGLIPPPKERMPGGYWSYVQMAVEDAIEADEKADMERCPGGFTLRTTHRLY